MLQVLRVDLKRTRALRARALLGERFDRVDPVDDLHVEIDTSRTRSSSPRSAESSVGKSPANVRRVHACVPTVVADFTVEIGCAPFGVRRDRHLHVAAAEEQHRCDDE